jgi:S-DNA-T family DNA segregation ATPase FtsK/SpoIIIE
MIDEFHALFGGTMKQAAYADKILNEQIIRIGRKFGMHVILSTQSLGGNVRKSILDNIPLRIALGMTADQSSGFLGGRNEAAANLEKGVAIYNHKNGELSANKKVQINFLKDEEIENMIIKANLRNLNCEQFDKTII